MISTKKVTMNRMNVLSLYGFIFSTTAPNTGVSKHLHKILDKLADLGIAPSDDGQSIRMDNTKESFELEFNKFELDAVKYVLSLRVNPNPQNNMSVSLAVERQVVWPLARILDIEDALRKTIRDTELKEPDLKLDSELVKEVKE